MVKICFISDYMDFTIKRILKYLEAEGITTREFERKCGLSNGYFANVKGVSLAKWYEIIKPNAPRLNEKWVFFGDGNMYVDDYSAAKEEAAISYSKGRPYFDIDFICGFDELFNSHTTTPAYLIDYPPYNKDGVIWCNATGASMEPEINNGDVVVLQEVQDWDSYMTFGETYAIATRNNLRTIKKVRKGSDNDHLLLVPVNKEYDEQEIPKNMILKVFRVLAAMKKF